MTTPTTNTPEPTAKDFQTPLLVALYALSGGKAQVAVPFKDTYQPVMTSMGISGLEAHGFNPDGKEKVAQWIQWAYKNLKRTDHVADAGRGQWALSDTGVTEVRNMNPPTVPVPTVKPAGVSSPVSPTTDPGSYHPDPYIRTLAAKATKCFGHFAHKSDICRMCRIQGPCINFLAAELSRIAAVLKREDAAEVERLAAAQRDAAQRAAQAAAPATAPAAAPAAAPATAPAAFDWSQWHTEKTRGLIAKAESVCPRCNRPVLKGTKAVWLRARVAMGGRKKAVLFHKECGPPDGV